MLHSTQLTLSNLQTSHAKAYATLMPNKTLFYAQGGGLGHLQRAVACLAGLGLSAETCLLASASPYLSLVAQQYNLATLPIPLAFQHQRHAYQHWLATQILENQITTIYIDVFPCGIIGEWNEALFALLPANYSLKFYYIGRRLQWKSYQQWHNKAIFFENSYLFEPLETAHQHFLEQQSKQITYLAPSTFLSLSPIIEPPQQLLQLLEKEQPYWLFIHSEPLHELLALFQLAWQTYQNLTYKPLWLIVSQLNPTLLHETLQTLGGSYQIKYHLLNSLQPHFLFEKAEKIFSGCGFNTMYQTFAFADKHYFLPFPRRYDDQNWRAEQRKLGRSM